MDEPSNMISPSSAFSNWLRGTSTFLLMPRMSVNCSRRKSTPNRLVSASTSSFPAPLRSVGKSFQTRPVAVTGWPGLGRRHEIVPCDEVSEPAGGPSDKGKR